MVEPSRFYFETAMAQRPGHPAGVDLPRVPVRIGFNDRDEDFPAQCALLFRRSAETCLTLKSMAVACTWPAGKLGRQTADDPAGWVKQQNKTPLTTDGRQRG